MQLAPHGTLLQEALLPRRRAAGRGRGCGLRLSECRLQRAHLAVAGGAGWGVAAARLQGVSRILPLVQSAIWLMHERGGSSAHVALSCRQRARRRLHLAQRCRGAVTLRQCAGELLLCLLQPLSVVGRPILA